LVVVREPKDATEKLPALLAPYDQIKGIVPVVASGFGGILIKRWVIETVLKGYQQQGEPPFSHESKMGEDFRFCHDARGQGATIAVNCDVLFGHRATFAMYWNKETQVLDCTENDYGLAIINK
jgi:hypothetical protein